MLHVRIIGILAFLVLAFAVWMGASRDFLLKNLHLKDAPYGLQGRVLAMEFIQTPDQVKSILEQNDSRDPGNQHNRDVMRLEMRRDFIWIASYASLYLAVSLMLARRSNSWAPYVATAAAVAGIAAAYFDVRENMGILRLLTALDSNQLADQQMVNEIHYAALIKWTLSFFALSLLALTFHGKNRWSSLVWYGFSATALVGLIVLLHPPLFPVVVVPLLISLLLLSGLAIGWPRTLMESS